MFDELKHIIDGQDLVINDRIKVKNPTLREIVDYGENKYLDLVTTLVARPYDAMVQLDDIGLDYQSINNYEFFRMNLPNLKKEKTEFLLGDIDLANMRSGENSENQQIVLFSTIKTDGGAEQIDLVIDELIYAEITNFVRSINYISSKIEFDVGNSFAKKMLIERNRRRLKKHKKFESQMSDLISGLINNEGFKYNYETIMNLHVSQFYNAFYRVNKINDYKNVVTGVYSGSVSSKDIERERINWAGKINI